MTPIMEGILGGFLEVDIQDIFPEIVQGTGVYKNKKVIVTEYNIEDSSHKSGVITEVRGKGHSLYDFETFLPIFGEGVFYVTAFSPKDGTINMKMETRLETSDVIVRNIIDSSSQADKDLMENSFASPHYLGSR